MGAIRTCLWVQSHGEEAAKFYTTLIPNSKIIAQQKFEQPEGFSITEISLDGVPYQIFSLPSKHQLNESTSIVYTTTSQEETDRVWNALIADGGEENVCAWCKDRFGVSWQIVPQQLIAAISSPDKAAAGRAMAAMQTMRKIDIAAIEAAFRGEI